MSTDLSVKFESNMDKCVETGEIVHSFIEKYLKIITKYSLFILGTFFVGSFFLLSGVILGKKKTQEIEIENI